MSRLLCLPVMMVSTHLARQTPKEKRTKHQADTNTINITSSNKNYILCIITNTHSDTQRRSANVVLSFLPFHLFVKTIALRATIQSRHNLNVRRMRTKFAMVFCVESVHLISICSLCMTRAEEDRQKTCEGLGNM